MLSLTRPAAAVISIVGATGCGKSKLAIELATRLRGEIINADALQVYHGLDIATNKVSLAEQQGIPHHLLGHVDPSGPAYTVQQFVSEAQLKIAELHARQTLPIVVGGTHYYLQSLLWHDQLTHIDNARSMHDSASVVDPKLRAAIQSALEHDATTLPSNALLDLLRQVDPVLAERWHPSDTRRIRRCLEIFLEQGQPASQVWLSQRAAPPQPRYWNIIFWVHCDTAVLYERLNRRVDDMLNRGLLCELETMRNELGLAWSEYGLGQAIGYKEFQSYLRSNNPESHDPLIEEGSELLKQVTRRYSRRQLAWIRKKMGPLCRIMGPGSQELSGWIDSESTAPTSVLYAFDGTHLDAWSRMVLEPAHTISLQALLHGTLVPLPGSDSTGTELSVMVLEMMKAEISDTASSMETMWKPKYCSKCNVIIHGTAQWTTHLKSKRHRKTSAKPELPIE